MGKLSGKVALITGSGRGIGSALAIKLASDGASVVVSDLDEAPAEETARAIRAAGGNAVTCTGNVTAPDFAQRFVKTALDQFGGLDIIVNTAAIFPSSPDGQINDSQWGVTLDINVTANHRLIEEASKILAEQDLTASVVLVSSANAVVPKRGSEAYDVSKAAVSHLVRELAISLAPKIRVNGISPATVVKGSTMFPRDRVIASLNKYSISFDAGAPDEELRTLLAEFYAKRTLTHQPIDPQDCAAAILFLAGPQSRCTTGHLIPVDGGLTEAFLR